ncbi:MAG: dTDP-4-dehydrorhamnose reductase [Myxococcales bacterium]|nr:dTDP-4-dehydrorhamnose reductase [Myxococcales bacterium]
MSTKITAVVLGAQGTLGRALVENLPRLGIDLLAAHTRATCDIAHEDAVEGALLSARPDLVFNAAAYTNVDKAEDEEDASYLANALGPENVARACARIDAKLVHYSTDFVFDGEQERPYDEFDPVSPQGAYARSKVAGERLVETAWAKHFILRVGCLYGQGGRNFPSTILDRLGRGESIKADAERKASPTWVVPVVEVSAALARTDGFGLYHSTANGETTWADYAHFLAGQLGISAEKVAALPYGALSLKAARPRRAILNNRMLRLRGLDTLGTWEEQALRFMQSVA